MTTHTENFGADTGKVGDLPIVHGNTMASLHDMGDAVVCFRAHSKMNTFDPDVFDVLDYALDRAGTDFRAMVLANDDPRAFSAGADLTFFTRMIDSPDGAAKISAYGQRGQGLFMRMMRSPVPVVAAVHGFALGGGCEFQMHADASVVHSAANLGLPEAGIGLIPGWGGCARVYARVLAAHPDRSAAEVAQIAFAALFAGKIAEDAAAARDLWLLRADDVIAPDRAKLAHMAKAKALSLVEGYVPPAPLTLPLAGAEGVEAIISGLEATSDLSQTDLTVARKLATILTGGAEAAATGSEADMMALEVKTLAQLVAWPPVRARIDHMLATGKRLKN